MVSFFLLVISFWSRVRCSSAYLRVAKHVATHILPSSTGNKDLPGMTSRTGNSTVERLDMQDNWARSWMLTEDVSTLPFDNNTDVLHDTAAWSANFKAEQSSWPVTSLAWNALAYMTHSNDQHQSNKTGQLYSALGDHLIVTSPRPFTNLPNNRVASTIRPGGWEISSRSFESLCVAMGPHTAECGHLIGRSLLYAITNPNIRYLWLMENDVYFFDANDVKEMMERYASSQADYISPHIRSYKQAPTWNHWSNLEGLFPHDESHRYYKAFSPIMRVSRRLIYQFVRLQRQKPQLGFLEGVLPTLAAQNGFIMEQMAPDMSQSLRYRPCWNLHSMNTVREMRKSNARNTGLGILFHPVKQGPNGFAHC